jgi:hypothetical protein
MTNTSLSSLPNLLSLVPVDTEITNPPTIAIKKNVKPQKGFTFSNKIGMDDYHNSPKNVFPKKIGSSSIMTYANESGLALCEEIQDTKAMKTGRLVHDLIERFFGRINKAKGANPKYKKYMDESLAEFKTLDTKGKQLLEAGSYSSKATLDFLLKAYNHLTNSQEPMIDGTFGEQKNHVRDLMSNCDFVSEEDEDIIRGVAAEILRREKSEPFLHLLRNCKAEYSIFTPDGLKARPDLLAITKEGAIHWSVKTTHDIAGFSRLVSGKNAQLGLQVAHYKKCIDGALGVDSSVCFLVFSTKKPFQSRLISIPKDRVEAWTDKYNEKLESLVLEIKNGLKGYEAFSAEGYYGVEII